MPEMTGIEATVRIRQDFPKEKQPVILALTADAFPETRQRCVSAGMEELLTKPVNKVELAKTLAKYQELINAKRLARQPVQNL
jgi:two-component system sensor histidine kinase/response regulator